MKDLVAIIAVIFTVGFFVCCAVAGVLTWRLVKWTFKKGRSKYHGA